MKFTIRKGEDLGSYDRDLNLYGLYPNFIPSKAGGEPWLEKLEPELAVAWGRFSDGWPHQQRVKGVVISCDRDVTYQARVEAMRDFLTQDAYEVERIALRSGLVDEVEITWPR